MKADKISEFNDHELAHQIAEAEDRLFRFKFQIAMGQTDGVKRYRELKKDRARMLTVRRQRELGAVIAPAGKPVKAKAKSPAKAKVKAPVKAKAKAKAPVKTKVKAAKSPAKAKA
jgi:large subunit ribosomal protein L29